MFYKPYLRMMISRIFFVWWEGDRGGEVKPRIECLTSGWLACVLFNTNFYSIFSRLIKIVGQLHEPHLVTPLSYRQHTSVPCVVICG
jgi:hypothetical protein